jgi:hypothetical protein
MTSDLNDFSDQDLETELKRRQNREFTDALEKAYPGLKGISIKQNRAELNEFTLYSPLVQSRFCVPRYANQYNGDSNNLVFNARDRALHKLVSLTFKTAFENYFVLNKYHDSDGATISRDFPEGLILMHPKTYEEYRRRVNSWDYARTY